MLAWHCSLSDRFLNEITSLPVHSVTSIDVVPIPKDLTTKTLQKKYLGIESDIIKQQRVRNKNNDFSSEISYAKRDGGDTVPHYRERAKGQGGLCTGILQNVTDLLQNYTASTLISNSEFIVLLKQSSTDSAKLAEVLGVSDAQLRFVNNSPGGTGLMKCGSVVVPFDNIIGKDTEVSHS